jgi:hypothetical protein
MLLKHLFALAQSALDLPAASILSFRNADIAQFKHQTECFPQVDSACKVRLISAQEFADMQLELQQSKEYTLKLQHALLKAD